jgi:lysyl-tRNA synthetase class 2
MMDITEALIRNAAMQACGTLELTYQGTQIDLQPPFLRLTMAEAVKKYSGVDFCEFSGDDKKAREAAKSLGVEVKKDAAWGDVLNEVFQEKAEDQLIEPTFVMDYPVEVSPLTKRKPENPLLTERFELFITAREFANAYSELNDPLDQMERFLRQAALRDAGDDEANMLDDDFVKSLEYGMPPTGGMGMGIDRLTMLLTDSSSIRDVLLFPTMKPVVKHSHESGAEE